VQSTLEREKGVDLDGLGGRKVYQKKLHSRGGVLELSQQDGQAGEGDGDESRNGRKKERYLSLSRTRG